MTSEKKTYIGENEIYVDENVKMYNMPNGSLMYNPDKRLLKKHSLVNRKIKKLVIEFEKVED